MLDCDFCAFGKRKRDEGAYELTSEDLVENARASIAMGAQEIHIVGGLHPTWKFTVYLDMLRALRALSPTVTLKAFTAITDFCISRGSRKATSRTCSCN